MMKAKIKKKLIRDSLLDLLFVFINRTIFISSLFWLVIIVHAVCVIQIICIIYIIYFDPAARF